MTAKTMIKTLSVRVKDLHAAVLDRMAVEVNQVWNLANEMSYEAWHVPFRNTYANLTIAS